MKEYYFIFYKNKGAFMEKIVITAESEEDAYYQAEKYQSANFYDTFEEII